jgi:hypothetical protein
MKISQQIVGVNQRLGNTAVPNMQGTTRFIFDSVSLTAATSQTVTYFQNVQSRPFPASNLSSNKFEVGESLAIMGITWFQTSALSSTGVVSGVLSTVVAFSNTLLFNLYIGNQRVIKDLDLNYGRFGVGEAYNPSTAKNILHFETPIVIPPQIEFYATLTVSSNVNTRALPLYLGLFGQGTLLNTKSNF